MLKIKRMKITLVININISGGNVIFCRKQIKTLRRKTSVIKTILEEQNCSVLQILS